MAPSWVDHQKRLKAFLGDKYVAPPTIPGKPEVVDPGEDCVGEIVDDDESASTSAFIVYRDSKGAHSQRRIIFRGIKGHFGKPETIGAHCMVRQRYRAFSVSNIEEMFCTATGEVLDPVEHCIALHRSGALKIEDKALVRVMRIFTFIARCDGEYHDLEQATIEDVLGRYFRFFGGEDDSYHRAVKEAPRLAPTAGDIVKAVNWMKRAPMGAELARFTLRSCGSIVDADGHHREEEVEWGIELSSMMKQLAMSDR